MIILTDIGSRAPGTCPACGRVMDASGCRIIGSRWTSADPQDSGGIARVMEIHCAMMSAIPESPSPAYIGGALKNVREAFGLSIHQFSAACAISPHRLMQIERGEVA